MKKDINKNKKTLTSYSL